MPKPPTTFTEAAYRSGMGIVSTLIDGTYFSNSRLIPYRELYRDRTALIESPADHLQRAAEDEARRSNPTQ